MGTNAFQEAPAVQITRPFTKWSYCVSKTNELEDVCNELKISTSTYYRNKNKNDGRNYPKNQTQN